MRAQPRRPDRPPPGSTVVGVHEAKTHLSKLLARVANGEVITISRNGTPVAELRSPEGPGMGIGILRDWDWQIDWETFDDPDPALIAAMSDGPI